MMMVDVGNREKEVGHCHKEFRLGTYCVFAHPASPSSQPNHLFIVSYLIFAVVWLVGSFSSPVYPTLFWPNIGICPSLLEVEVFVTAIYRFPCLHLHTYEHRHR